MKKNLLLSILIFLGIYIQGQDINTDRSDQNEGTYTLPKGIFQIEGGFDVSEGEFAPVLMLRYGLGKSMEIRIETDFSKDIWNTKFNDFTLSMKKKIFGRENVPNFTLIGYVAYDNVEKDMLNLDLLLASDYDLSDKWSITANIGSSDGFEKLLLASQIGYNLANSYTFFLEYQGIFNKYSPQHNFTTGLKYLLNNNLQLDTVFGFSAFSSNSDNYMGLGIAYRFSKNR